jgi:hypothetical protein
MKKFLLSAALIAIAILLLVLSPGQNFVGELIGMLAVGAVINQGILGGVRGKVGNVVGGAWKGIDWLRVYVIPKDAQSPAQVLRRDRMRRIVYISKQVLTTIIRPFWDNSAIKMSGFNAFIKANINSLAATTLYITETFKLTKGSLLDADFEDVIYNPDDGNISVSWPNNSGTGNALSTDDFSFFLFDREGALVFAGASPDHRGEGVFSAQTSPGFSAEKLFAFCFFSRGVGSQAIVSTSYAMHVIEA